MAVGSNPDRNGLLICAIGAVLACAAYAAPPVHWVLSYLATLVHESGHALAGISFGYPSIPSFDLLLGGGATMIPDKPNPYLTACAWVAVIVISLKIWNRRTLPLVICLLAAYAALSLTSWHRCLILSAGHGAELVAAGIFVHRALSGAAIENPVERPLYAVIGFYLALSNMILSWSLLFDQAFRREYFMGKDGSGVALNDLLLIADDFCGGRFAILACILLVLSIMTPVICVVPMMISNRSRSTEGNHSPGNSE